MVRAFRRRSDHATNGMEGDGKLCSAQGDIRSRAPTFAAHEDPDGRILVSGNIRPTSSFGPLVLLNETNRSAAHTNMMQRGHTDRLHPKFPAPLLLRTDPVSPFEAHPSDHEVRTDPVRSNGPSRPAACAGL